MLKISALTFSLAVTPALAVTPVSEPWQSLDDYLKLQQFNQNILQPFHASAQNMLEPTLAVQDDFSMAIDANAAKQGVVTTPNPRGRRALAAEPKVKLAKSTALQKAEVKLGSFILFNDLEINVWLSTGRLDLQTNTGHIQLAGGGSDFDWLIDDEDFVVITPQKPIFMQRAFIVKDGRQRERVTYIDKIEFRYEVTDNGTINLIGDQLVRYHYPQDDYADETMWGSFNHHALGEEAKLDVATLVPVNKNFSLPFNSSYSVNWFYNNSELRFSSNFNTVLVNLNEQAPQGLSGEWGFYAIGASGEPSYITEAVNVTFNPDGSANFTSDSGKTANLRAYQRPSDQAVIYNVLQSQDLDGSNALNIARTSAVYIKNPELNFSIPGIYQVRQDDFFGKWWFELNEDGSALSVRYNVATERHSTLPYRWQYGVGDLGPHIELRIYEYHTGSGKSGYCESAYFDPPANSDCKLFVSETLELFDTTTITDKQVLLTNRYFTIFDNPYVSADISDKIYSSSSVGLMSFNMLAERPVPFPTQTPIDSVQFNDARLQQCINSFSVTYLENIISMSCQGVVDITGIEKLVNLRELTLWGENWDPNNLRVLTDLTPITKLDKLTRLTLAQNNLSDASLQTLAGFKFASGQSLVGLYLHRNALTAASLPFIEGILAEVESDIILNLSYNQFQHLGNLASLARLYSIGFGGNPFLNTVNTINQFKDSSLKMLAISELGLTSFDGIELPANLISLDIPFNQLDSLQTLLPKLNVRTLNALDISGMRVNNLGFVTALVNLTNLRLDFTRIQSLAPLFNLPGLNRVSIAGLNLLACNEITELATTVTVDNKPDICFLGGNRFNLTEFFGQNVIGVQLADNYQHLGQLTWSDGVFTFTPSEEAKGYIMLRLEIQTSNANYSYFWGIDADRAKSAKRQRRGLPKWLYVIAGR